MKPRMVKYYDWFEDIEPVILENLNDILVSKNIEPLEDLHGGWFLDGKWVGVGNSTDYRNYWHVFIELWGERIHNGTYVNIYFPETLEDWDYARERAVEYRNEWAADLVEAVYKMVQDNPDLNEDWSTLVYFNW